jgi:hypothetical protein
VETARFSNSWFAVDQAVRLSLGEATYPEFTGRILELSAKAVRLRTDRPLSRGSAVQLSWNDTVVSAEVRRCIAIESDFLIEFGLRRIGRIETQSAAVTM